MPTRAAAVRSGSGGTGLFQGLQKVGRSLQLPIAVLPAAGILRAPRPARRARPGRPRLGQGRQGLRGGGRRAPRPTSAAAAVLHRRRDRLREEVGRLHGASPRSSASSSTRTCWPRSPIDGPAEGRGGASTDEVVTVDRPEPGRPRRHHHGPRWSPCSGSASTARSCSTGWASSTAAGWSRSSWRSSVWSLGVALRPTSGRPSATGLHSFGEWLIGLGRGRGRHLRCRQPRADPDRHAPVR